MRFLGSPNHGTSSGMGRGMELTRQGNLLLFLTPNWCLPNKVPTTVSGTLTKVHKKKSFKITRGGRLLIVPKDMEMKSSVRRIDTTIVGNKAAVSNRTPCHAWLPDVREVLVLL